MFDYNFLGVGFRYNDIRNVCSSLSSEATDIFLKEYGSFDETEKIIDDCTSILIDLIHAYKRDSFPSWAMNSLNAVHNGRLEESYRKILNISIENLKYDL